MTTRPATEDAAAGARHSAQPHAWAALRLLILYRLLLATILAVTPVLVEQRVLGSTDPALFRLVSVVYLGLGAVAGIAFLLHRSAYRAQVISQVIVDVLAVTLMMHASDGVHGGLGILLVIAVAGGSLLLPGRTAYLFAALATLAVLATQAYDTLFSVSLPIADFARAGMLGIACFATATLSHLLARRIQESEALAARRGVDLANLTQLNEYVIQHLRAGVLVVDHNQVIRLVNAPGWRLLGLNDSPAGTRLTEASRALSEQLEDWLRDPGKEPRAFRPPDRATEVSPRFLALNPGGDRATLIFLEDAGVLAREAQEVKFAAMGRLTASIAHEVRNPLGAINHAAQLLAESAAIGSDEQRITEIIQVQSRRVNKIVEDILRLSRSKPSLAEPLALEPWLERFVQEFCGMERVSPDQLTLDAVPADLVVRFDPGHLHQVLENLCRNALLHGAPADGETRISLRCTRSQESGTCLDVCDNGPGIPADKAQEIFEPFYTSAARGSGLGLYIARELCEHNQASLTYRAGDNGGACFRLRFGGTAG